MNKWLANANETLDKCSGIGDENETRQKLLAITVCFAITVQFKKNI